MTLITILAVLPFYLNDFFFYIFQDQYLPFILVFYFTDLLGLGLTRTLTTIQQKINSFDINHYQQMPLKDLVKWSVLLTIYGVTIDRTIGPTLGKYFHWRLFHFPHYPNSIYRWMDLTYGLLLVSVAEEVVFRGILLKQLKTFFSDTIYNSRKTLTSATQSITS